MRFPAMPKLALAALLLSLSLPVAGAETGRVLFDFDQGMPQGAEFMHDAKVSLRRDAAGQVLCIAGPASARWPGIKLPAPGGHWDFSPYQALAVDVRNTGASRVRIGLRFDGRDTKGQLRWRQEMVELGPGESAVCRTKIQLTVTTDVDGQPIDLPGMISGPWGRLPRRSPAERLDPRRVPQTIVFAGRPKEPFAIEVDNLRLTRGTLWRPTDGRSFFPFVDQFGQYLHAQWPGKTESVAQMRRGLAQELEDIKLHPGPETFDKYGGYEPGPTLRATGFFRTEKHRGKWWLVDPVGKLFFSYGITAVRIQEEFTPITDRERWFSWMPVDDAEFRPFFGPCTAWKGRLRGKRMKGFSFARANMYRRYGPDWQQQAADMAHPRLRSWGMNTLANWSEPQVCLMKRTPYTVAVHARYQHWLGDRANPHARFPDVFHPQFASALRERMKREVGKTAGDPWCMGYFVDNELKWASKIISLAALGSPADSPAKKQLVAMLRDRHGTVQALNRVWGTRHESWDALLQDTKPPKAQGAQADLDAFVARVAERYFTAVRAAVKGAAPNNLYLGCRFNTFTPEPARAAAKYCDVVSYNYYRLPAELAGFEFPGQADVPLLVGEWHFGALDRGWFWGGIREVKSQQERAQMLQDYMRAALGHPQFVGAHWFRYRTQPLTGRPSNGENGQIGFVDLCDAPYPETIAASRTVGRNLYTYRLSGAWKP